MWPAAVAATVAAMGRATGQGGWVGGSGAGKENAAACTRVRAGGGGPNSCGGLFGPLSATLYCRYQDARTSVFQGARTVQFVRTSSTLYGGAARRAFAIESWCGAVLNPAEPPSPAKGAE
jgi:hypothetical protein